MAVSREEYKRIIDTNRSGNLTIFIDTAEFRKLLCNKIDVAKLSDIIGKSVNSRIRLITTLTHIDSAMPLLASLLSVLGFGWWGIIGIAAAFILWAGHKMHACRDKQHILPITTTMLITIAIALFAPLANIYVRGFIISCGVMLFIGRMLYVCTAYIVFSLIETNYEFFNMFYLEPKGAVVPLIWTSELDREFEKHK